MTSQQQQQQHDKSYTLPPILCRYLGCFYYKPSRSGDYVVTHGYFAPIFAHLFSINMSIIITRARERSGKQSGAGQNSMKRSGERFSEKGGGAEHGAERSGKRTKSPAGILLFSLLV